MALEALEVMLFILLFGIDAYAYGNLNEIRRMLANLDGKVKGSYTHIETTRVKEIAAAVKEEEKAPGKTASDWHASALEDDLAGVRSEQSIQEQKLREVEDKLAMMHPASGSVDDERLAEMERRLDDRLSALENSSFGASAGSADTSRIERKLDEIASGVEGIRERVGGVEQEISALNAASEVQRSEMLQRIEDGTSGFSDRLFEAEERLTGKLKRTQRAEKVLRKRVKKVRANVEAQKSTLSRRVKKVEKTVVRKTAEAEKAAMTAKKAARKTAHKVTVELGAAGARKSRASRGGKVKTVKKTVTTTTSKAKAARKIARPAKTRKSPTHKAVSGKVTEKTVTKVTRKTPKSSAATKTFEKTVTTEKIVKKAGHAKKKAARKARKRPARKPPAPKPVAAIEKVVKEETTVTTESDSSFEQSRE